MFTNIFSPNIAAKLSYNYTFVNTAFIMYRIVETKENLKKIYPESIIFPIPYFLLCCCLPCNHCSIWTRAVEEMLAFLVVGCVLRTAGTFRMIERLAVKIDELQTKIDIGKI